MNIVSWAAIQAIRSVVTERKRQRSSATVVALSIIGKLARITAEGGGSQLMVLPPCVLRCIASETYILKSHSDGKIVCSG